MIPTITQHTGNPNKQVDRLCIAAESEADREMLAAMVQVITTGGVIHVRRPGTHGRSFRFPAPASNPSESPNSCPAEAKS